MANPVMVTLLLVVSVILVTEGAINYPASPIPDSTHLCQRQCSTANSPLTCIYYFQVHYYLTMSKACHECPFVEEDCYRPYCNYADGHRRAMVSINRQTPGPAIEVCEGDLVKVKVHNILGDGGATTIHWHGQHMNGQQYYDGADMVTQCGINEQSNFTYQFYPDAVGTHWYHSHTGFQRSDGLAGPFIVHPYKERDPHWDQYDHDCAPESPSGDCEIWFLFTSWYDELAAGRFSFRMNWGSRSFMTSAILNGQGQKYNVTNINDPAQVKLTPWPVITVQPGKRYLIRGIDIGHDDCPFKHFIDGHRLQVAYADGQPVLKKAVDVIGFYPGERYDYILDTSQAEIGNYWIKMLGMVDCTATNASAFAILHYEGAPDAEPTEDRMADNTDGVFLNPVWSIEQEDYPTFWNEPWDTQNIIAVELNSTENENWTDEVVDVVYYIGMDMYQNDEEKFNDPVYYPVRDLPELLKHTTPVLDNLTIELPNVPILSQPNDFDYSTLCNRSSSNMTACRENLCICTHYLHFDLGQTIEIIMVNEGFGSADAHPMHLHGYNFRLMGMESLGGAVYMSTVITMNNNGQLKRKYIDPSYRDTVQVPDGGYTIIRFVADNPGYWFLHCHVDVHLSQGMGLVIGIGDQSDLPPVPVGFPTCGNFEDPDAPSPPIKKRRKRSPGHT